jgi:hypothetical protein
VETDVVPVSVIKFAKLTAELTVNKVPCRATSPPPLCVNVPAMEVPAPAINVRGPVFEMETGPGDAVIRSPLMVKSVPVRETPPPAVVFKLPRVESPVPPVCVIELAVILEAVML